VFTASIREKTEQSYRAGRWYAPIAAEHAQMTDQNKPEIAGKLFASLISGEPAITNFGN